MSIFVHEFPGPRIRFVREARVTEGGNVAAAAATAFAALAPVMVPLQLEVDLALFDPELGMVRNDEVLEPHRFGLRQDEPSNQVYVVSRAQRIETASSLTPDIIELWLTRLLVMANAGRCIGVTELVTKASEAYARDFDGQPLVTRSAEVSVPVRRKEGQTWVSGPVSTAPGQPPLHVTIRHEFHQMEATIGIEWSWWSEGPGRIDVDAAVANLAGLGWIRQ
jgi:hypothetical protein